MNCTRLVITTSAIALTAALAAAQDAVLQWNAAALTAIRTAVTPPPPASRTLAILHASIHDAVNGIQPRYEHYLVFPAAPAHSSAVAAASAAAHFVLRAVYPAQSATFDALEATILGTIPDGPDKTNGILWGEQTAQQILAARANDGSAIPGSYPGSNLPGLWRPTVSFGGLIRPALLPQWGNVTPFALLGGSQFRPPAPPALNTFQYGFEVLQVQYFGGRTGSFRSAEQTETAHFWAYGPNTATPPGHWNQIAQQVAHTGRGTLAENARMFALLDIAMADAAIASWDCK
ncbi:MAG TPA: chemotaxis protein CheB, partial [Planctomycetota bacterium]|nr:chemotaxis protein CheB [Planctomycetota bacterium]